MMGSMTGVFGELGGGFLLEGQNACGIQMSYDPGNGSNRTNRIMFTREGKAIVDILFR